MLPKFEDYPLVKINGRNHRIVPLYDRDFIAICCETINTIWWNSISQAVDTHLDKRAEIPTVEIMSEEMGP